MLNAASDPPDPALLKAMIARLKSVLPLASGGKVRRNSSTPPSWDTRRKAGQRVSTASGPNRLHVAEGAMLSAGR